MSIAMSVTRCSSPNKLWLMSRACFWSSRAAVEHAKRAKRPCEVVHGDERVRVLVAKNVSHDIERALLALAGAGEIVLRAKSFGEIVHHSERVAMLVA